MPSPNDSQDQVGSALVARTDLFAVVPCGNDYESAYATAVIDRIRREGPSYNPTALILVPTRELAIQIHETVFQASGRGSIANALGVFEGKPVTSQIGPLKHGVDIVIGTPGRVLEHVRRKTLRIEQLKVLVLDRLDEMLDLGLGRDLEAIIQATPKTRHTALFAATAPKPVLAMARDHLREPELVGIEREEFESVATPRSSDTQQVNLHFNAGKGAGITPRDLLGAITNEGGVRRDQVGAITIKQNFSLVAVDADEAEDIVRKLRNAQVRGRKVKVRHERFSHRRG